MSEGIKLTPGQKRLLEIVASHKGNKCSGRQAGHPRSDLVFRLWKMALIDVEDSVHGGCKHPKSISLTEHGLRAVESTKP